MHSITEADLKTTGDNKILTFHPMSIKVWTYGVGNSRSHTYAHQLKKFLRWGHSVVHTQEQDTVVTGLSPRFVALSVPSAFILKMVSSGLDYPLIPRQGLGSIDTRSKDDLLPCHSFPFWVRRETNVKRFWINILLAAMERPQNES